MTEQITAACVIARGVTLHMTVDVDDATVAAVPLKELFDVLVDAAEQWLEAHPPLSAPRPARACPSSTCRAVGLPTTRRVCNVCGAETVEKT